MDYIMGNTQKDLLGELELPDGVLYGIQTERARRHFDLAGRPAHPRLIHALLQVKRACAMTNRECGFLEKSIADGIINACLELEGGAYQDQFVTDALQGGAGTSTNMNVNEVVASLATRHAGAAVHPLQHVNLHQSTNDVYPTALHIAALRALADLEPAVTMLQEACQAKEREFADVVKPGRTQLRDAVPITLGREFGAAAGAMSRDRWRIFKCAERLRTVNLGGTAIGTGLTAPRLYIFGVIEQIRQITGLNLARAENLVDATQNQDVFVEVSGILRAHAVNLVKLARDLRLLASGPECGFGEIELPAIQPGSTIMPGKINPVIPEMVIQAAFRVYAHDHEIGLAAMSGELELNAFMPLIADALLAMLDLLQRTDQAFARHCISGIRAHAAHCRALMERSRETVTALIPVIGHDKAVALSQLMAAQGLDLRAAVQRDGCLTETQLDQLLSPDKLCALGWHAPAHSPAPN